MDTYIVLKYIYIYGYIVLISKGGILQTFQKSAHLLGPQKLNLVTFEDGGAGGGGLHIVL